MKVDGGNGKFYTRDHPHEIISPHIMRFDEIRFWMVELPAHHGWAKVALERALGMTKGSLKRRLTVGWIWPREQKRFTARLREIMDGHLVMRRIDGKLQPVYVEAPVPLELRQPAGLTLYASIRGLSFQAPPPRPKLPDAKNAFKNVATWNPVR